MNRHELISLLGVIFCDNPNFEKRRVMMLSVYSQRFLSDEALVYEMAVRLLTT